MIFLKVSDLTPGMCMARDLNFYDTASRGAVCIRHGQKLTDVLITKLKVANIDGAYIDGEHSEVRVISSINRQIKTDAINNLQSLSENFIDSGKGVMKRDIEEIGGTTEMLIDALSEKKDILVNIADIKMYDDYTFHHSLSVAIMAIAVGIELGFSKAQLYELGLSGLLHDIGKVSVPIEIINKNGRLTPEEFAIVKMHPVHAANHLMERGLVPKNVLLGIVAHHERWDGTGYPYGLKGNNIPYYARILAVADVYDALTSNRPYRTPSPPNEAIEFIMGGTGAHFDENIVHAFLRKVAPYPTGTHILLSNHKEATVLKNNPDQPLRPLVSVTDDDGIAQIYDMCNDIATYNVVISGLAESDESSDEQE